MVLKEHAIHGASNVEHMDHVTVVKNVLENLKSQNVDGASK